MAKQVVHTDFKSKPCVPQLLLFSEKRKLSFFKFKTKQLQLSRWALWSFAHFKPIQMANARQLIWNNRIFHTSQIIGTLQEFYPCERNAFVTSQRSRATLKIPGRNSVKRFRTSHYISNGFTPLFFLKLDSSGELQILDVILTFSGRFRKNATSSVGSHLRIFANTIVKFWAKI